jgi:hypothetical protein
MLKLLLATVFLCALGVAAAYAQTGAPLPQGREAGTAPYDPFAHGQAAQAAPAKAELAPSGFRITVLMCRKAEQANDPLAKTPECASLLKAAEGQAKACRQAFENGDDKAALSEGCRQAAGFR